MPADPNRVRDIFLAALELSPEQRPAYLAEACRGDADLRAEVERLLAANAAPDSILEPASSHPGTALVPGTPAATQAFDPDPPTPTAIATEFHRPENATPTQTGANPDGTTAAESQSPAPRGAKVATGEGIGTVIASRYTLVEVIGEGGMGSVYLASQTEPVKRQVALKLIKTGLDSRACWPASTPSGRPSRSWTTPTSPASTTAASPPPATPSSSWSWCMASRSPSTATRSACR